MRRPALFVLLPFVFAACPAGGQTPAQGAIEGEVRNAVTGDPIPGARIKLFAPNAEARYVRAASDGRFRFVDISAGNYSVDAEAPGFLQCGEPSRRDFIRVVLMPLRPREVRPEVRAVCASVTESVEPDGMLRASMTISLTPYGVITGRITDPNGIPVADSPVEVLGVRVAAPEAVRRPGVHLLPDGKNELIRVTSARTNDLGDFRAARLSPGAYYIVATKPGGWGRFPATYRDTYYPRTVDFASAKPLDVAAGRLVRADIRVADVAGVRVAGRLVNAPPQDAGAGSSFYTNLVLVRSREYSLSGSPPFTIAAGDSYEFKDVLPGSYKLLALTRDRAGDPWGHNHKPVLGASPHVEVGLQDLDGIDVVLQPLREISGIVTFAEGCSPEPLRVIVYGFTSLAESRAEATPDSQGRFVLTGLTPATLTIRIEAVRSRRPPVLLSARLGERDAMKDGFDYPAAPDETLRITVGCADQGRAQ